MKYLQTIDEMVYNKSRDFPRKTNQELSFGKSARF